ncbi:S1 family peptidase [Lipingzhangella sp. LS1_29]|uniref:S1 family peptidase n=1 Tax=Lipingzhangella rawalii TaxID=2055835 RepID=A0ABU2HBW0_9ACTN|nr:S1 family peptidase [Lipingzhangella rawalii]MDS1272089.1 S1 family peptidase [Lipingzhangella rawalii]
MHASRFIGVAGSLVLTGGLVAGGVALASADSQDVSTTATTGAANAATPDGQVAALADSLDISPTDAADLVDLQQEAAEVQAELETDLGSEFGGAVFDSESGDLTVHVTDETALSEVTAAGAQAELVDNGQDALEEIVADLDAAQDSADEAITSWYADVEEDTVVVETLDGESDAATEFLTAAGVDDAATTVEVRDGAERPELFQNIVGGEYYQTGQGTCSVGFSVDGGFVTAGHCGGVGTQTSGPDGVVAGSDFPGADKAWVETDPGWTPTPEVTDHSGGTVTVTGHEEAPVGAEVCRSGGTTGWHCGTIEATNETVQYPEGTVHGLTRTSACAEPGDSGGSWLAGTQAQGVTSGGSGNCTWGGTTYFQPLNPILDEWNLDLVTG